MLLIAERVAGRGVLHTDRGGDIAGIDRVDILAVIGVHLQDAAHTLLAVLHGVVDSSTCLDLTGVDTEVCQLTNEWVCHNLECKSCKWLFVRRMSYCVISIHINTLDCRNI